MPTFFMVMVGMPRCGVPVRQDGMNVVKRPYFPSPDAALGDGHIAARCPYLPKANKFADETKMFGGVANEFGGKTNMFDHQANKFHRFARMFGHKTNKFGDEAKMFGRKTNWFRDKTN